MQQRKLSHISNPSKVRVARRKRNGISSRPVFKIFLRKISRFYKYALVLLILSGASFLLFYTLFKSSYFKVSEITVTGAGSFVNLTDITEIVRGKVTGISIVAVKSAELESNLLETFQGAKEIKVHKIYPRKISVEVRERVPLAVVYKNPGEDYYLVDEAGYVLGQVEEEKTNLPQIHYDGVIKIGYFLDQNMVPVYLELVDAINSENVNVSSISFSSDHAKIYLPEGTEIFIKNESDKKESVSLISSLLKQLILEGKKVKKIDLRFDKVIVSYD